jgi:hypothetical protein
MEVVTREDAAELEHINSELAGRIVSYRDTCLATIEQAKELVEENIRLRKALGRVRTYTNLKWIRAVCTQALKLKG